MTARPLSPFAKLLTLAALGVVGAGVSLGPRALWGDAGTSPVTVVARAVAPPAAEPPATGAALPPVAATVVTLDGRAAAGLRPLAEGLAPLVAGRTSWVRIPWTSDAAVCSVSMTVTSAGSQITYPDNTKGYSSFYRADRLPAAGRDYTAVSVRVPAASTARAVTADVVARYTSVRQVPGAARSTCSGPVTTHAYRVTLPVSTGV